MKRFSKLALVLMVTLVISACGTPAAPTANPADLLSTAGAVAFTMVAETQSAIPTSTPFPPTAMFTDTPAPTNTLPASQLTSTPVPNSNSGSGDPCVNKAMPTSLPGETVKIRINNSTKVTLAVSVYLNQIAPGGQCGYRTYTIASQESLIINDLVEGCYTLWAWNPDPEGYFIVTNGTTCVDNSEPWAFDISTRSIQLKS